MEKEELIKMYEFVRHQIATGSEDYICIALYIYADDIYADDMTYAIACEAETDLQNRLLAAVKEHPELWRSSDSQHREDERHQYLIGNYKTLFEDGTAFWAWKNRDARLKFLDLTLNDLRNGAIKEH